jgi:hypothetical protein
MKIKKFWSAPGGEFDPGAIEFDCEFDDGRRGRFWRRSSGGSGDGAHVQSAKLWVEGERVEVSPLQFDDIKRGSQRVLAPLEEKVISLSRGEYFITYHETRWKMVCPHGYRSWCPLGCGPHLPRGDEVIILLFSEIPKPLREAGWERYVSYPSQELFEAWGGIPTRWVLHWPMPSSR